MTTSGTAKGTPARRKATAWLMVSWIVTFGGLAQHATAQDSWIDQLSTHVAVDHVLTADERLKIDVSGIWIDTCVPDQIVAEVADGRIDLVIETPSLNQACGDALTEWSWRGEAGRVTAGETYAVYVSADQVDSEDRALRVQVFPPVLKRADYFFVSGDFDGDDEHSFGDIDLLAAHVRTGVYDSRFDLNLDNIVDRKDHEYWIEEVFQTYLGDANLDGMFATDDFVQVFQYGQYEDDIGGNSTWATGDWNADGEFNSSDLVAAFTGCGYEGCCDWCGPRTVLPAPEPETSLPLVMAILSVVWLRRP